MLLAAALSMSAVGCVDVSEEKEEPQVQVGTEEGGIRVN